MIKAFFLVLLLFVLKIDSYRPFVIPVPQWQGGRKKSLQLKMVQSELPITTSDLSTRTPQILTFTEPSTNVTVILIGSMHYNPRSIELAKSTIEQYAQQEKLASVIIESCAIRWNKTIDLFSTTPNPSSSQSLQKGSVPTISQLRKEFQSKWKEFSKQTLFYNEMYAAEETAKKYSIPVILGDQLINVTTANMIKSFSKTMKDLVNPFKGGWERIKEDLQETYPIALPSGPDYLGIQDFLNVELLLSTPVTLFRYPLSLALRAPLLLLPVFISALTVQLPNLFLPNGGEGVDTSSIVTSFLGVDDSLSQTFDSIGNILGLLFAVVVFPIVEFVILGRVFLINILAERNVVLAESILQQCQAIVNQGRSNEVNTINRKEDDLFSGFINLFGKIFPKKENTEFMENNIEIKEESSPEKVVIAVLGMAHCNGIKKLLTSSLVTNNDGTVFPSVQPF